MFVDTSVAQEGSKITVHLQYIMFPQKHPRLEDISCESWKKTCWIQRNLKKHLVMVNEGKVLWRLKTQSLKQRKCERTHPSLIPSLLLVWEIFMFLLEKPFDRHKYISLICLCKHRMYFINKGCCNKNLLFEILF